MRLCITRLAASRAWTVELRPRPQGPVLICGQCPPRSESLNGRTARSAALAHLALHARGSLLPVHLRTCQCHERGCRWHPRHRGCSGPLLLVLSRERGGRLWRLADMCGACTSAMSDASVVPETTLATAAAPAPPTPRRRPQAAHQGGGPERALTRDMLSYLAASLPQRLSAEARFLALQCTLRSTTAGTVTFPAGLMRAMALPPGTVLWEELASARLLSMAAAGAHRTSAQLTEPLVGTLGRSVRARAADWSLRAYRSPIVPQPGASHRLVAVALAAHTPPGSTTGVAEAGHLARMSGLARLDLLSTMELLAARRVLGSWTLDPYTDDLAWIAGSQVSPACAGTGP